MWVFCVVLGLGFCCVFGCFDVGGCIFVSGFEVACVALMGAFFHVLVVGSLVGLIFVSSCFFRTGNAHRSRHMIWFDYHVLLLVWKHGFLCVVFWVCAVDPLLIGGVSFSL